MTRIIGLLGPAGSGKSSVAGLLEREYGARRYSLALPLKEMAQRMLGFTDEQVYGTQAQKEAVDPRYGFSPRWFLQRLGTEGIRQTFGADVWVKLCLQSIAHDKPELAVIEDVRFQNEAAAISHMAKTPMVAEGEIWRLERPGPAGTSDPGVHTSESEWMDTPYDIRIAPKAVGLEELFALVREVMDAK